MVHRIHHGATVDTPSGHRGDTMEFQWTPFCFCG